MTAIHPRIQAAIDMALQEGDLGALNEMLYDTAKMVLQTWEKGDLAGSVRQLQATVDAITKLMEETYPLPHECIGERT